MPIAVTCSQCQHTVHVKDEHAGKRGRCPQCQAIVPIPALPVPATVVDDDDELRLEPLNTAPADPALQAIDAVPLMPRGQPLAPRTVPAPAAERSAGHAAATSATLVARAPPLSVPVKVEQEVAALPAGDGRAIRDRVLAGFQGSVQRVPTTAAYKLGILLTAVFMILLPLIYIAMIGLACLLVYWHLTTNHFIFAGVRGRGAIIALALYVAPLIVGGIMILFMIKPLFARPATEGRRRNLTPRSDPLLFEFVERICRLVGSPLPRRIDVDCDINASAGFRAGWLSVFSGRDLVLRIGMPLVAGLTAQQFAGVLAHEFGHFSQGTGMRLTYIIRSINHWFVRVVYERDSWDSWLAETSENVDIRFGFMLYAARACVWLTRKILWGLMYAGHLVAGFMLRQMEFDADKYETRVGGSGAFESTSRQLRLLGIAWHGAEVELGRFYREGRLVDNLPRLMMAKLQELPPDVQKLVDELVEKSKTELFDTHPADKDRIAAARAENAAGAFHSDLPATALFTDFDAAARNVTWDYYCSIFGTTIDPKSLHPTEALVARSVHDQAAGKARNRFFADGFSGLRPLRLPIMPASGATQSPVLWQAELAESRNVMQAHAADYRKSVDAFDDADSRLVQSIQARSVLSSGVRMQGKIAEVAYHNTGEASLGRDRATAELGRLSRGMEIFEDAAGKRLRANLLLLGDAQLVQRLPDAAGWRQEADRLLPVVGLVATNHAGLLALRNHNATLVALLGHLEGNERNEVLIREILDYSDRVRAQLADLKQHFDRVLYPFDHAQGPITIGNYLLKMIPLREQVGDVCEAGESVLAGILEMYSRALSRLCVIAEAVEADQGYAPLPGKEA